MSWRDRKHDVYTNHGKETITTLRPSMSSTFFVVSQDQKYIGAQKERTFEGVFPLDKAEEVFMQLVIDAHAEIVEAPGHGEVLVGVIGEDDE